MPEVVDAPGIARAGAAFATRRKELGISQRELAARKVISAPALIAFEKGRAWPRERTRALLEEVVGWPAGTLANVRTGDDVTDDRAKVRATITTTLAPSDGSAPLIAGAVDVAMNTVRAAIATLPDPADPRFGDAARTVLRDLRQLEAITVKAVRTSANAPGVIRALATVRRAYDDLMFTAAESPGATLGQRLYTARRRANLSVAEVADAVSAPTEVVAAVEGEQPVSAGDAARLEALIATVSE
ncbi:XRE family transcriptional regulator [Mycolicibacterium sp. P1-18]|uniref:helix-turn-helix domain-containing protein n=1 Tax=Mycolicibacterium sp. P1-18 TaxID=2024615 RepID=UPI0011F1B9B4|nr:helix-turn-helix transcriptional regulator [Mycolicibacterium sp. P1-18]KAA0093571.1 XRE family transcriptional regulator [Mycolicibacterium sp. P1-18]